VTSPVGYVRLHGRNYDQWFDAETRDDRYNYLYTVQELSGWRDKVQRIAKKAEVTYVVTNNHFEAKAAVNGLHLKHMLTGKRVKSPEPLLRHYPELLEIADTIEDKHIELPLLDSSASA
jgi:uncharacterized protein YecE (DUF72 family)